MHKVQQISGDNSWTGKAEHALPPIPRRLEHKANKTIAKPSAGTPAKETARETPLAAIDKEARLLRDKYLQYAGKLAETTVAVLIGVEIAQMRKATRSRAEIAEARQMAMYVAHVSFGLTFSEVGMYFRRDRTTVSHACRRIEMQRDDPKTERMLCQIEEIINAAQDAFFSGAPLSGSSNGDQA